MIDFLEINTLCNGNDSAQNITSLLKKRWIGKTSKKTALRLSYSREQIVMKIRTKELEKKLFKLLQYTKCTTRSWSIMVCGLICLLNKSYSLLRRPAQFFWKLKRVLFWWQQFFSRFSSHYLLRWWFIVSYSHKSQNVVFLRLRGWKPNTYPQCLKKSLKNSIFSRYCFPSKTENCQNSQ